MTKAIVIEYLHDFTYLIHDRRGRTTHMQSGDINHSGYRIEFDPSGKVECCEYYDSFFNRLSSGGPLPQWASDEVERLSDEEFLDQTNYFDRY
jgi:hypothetical protein